MATHKGKVILVTGAAGGIGQALSQRFSADGGAVVVTDVVDVTETAELCKKHCEDVLSFSLDVTKKSNIRDVVDTILMEWGRIDILINNAGVFDNTALTELSEEKWDWVSDINYKSMFLLAQAAAPGMKTNRWGRIINLSSMAGKMAYPKEVAYCSTKAAVLGLTRALAIELGPYGITANAICPGPIETSMLRNTHQKLADEHGISKEKWDANVLKTIPVGRFGKPEDIANLVAFLASDEASFINGQGINIDGGMVFY